MKAHTKIIICSQPGRYYELSGCGVDSIWIENEAGEGMQIAEDKFYELIDKFFKENF